MQRNAALCLDRRGAQLQVRLLLLWVFWVLPAAYAANLVEEPGGVAATNPEAALFAAPTTHDHVGRVVVPVTINGRGPFRFIVDTGANHSTISPALVQLLGLQPAASTPILLNGITGSAQVSFVTVDRLQAGDLTLQGEVLPVVSAPLFAGADGILGAAGLTAKSLMVDFQHNRVAISRSVAAAVRAQATKIHALRLTYGLITVETRVGGIRVLAVIDTGSERTLGNLALRDKLYAHSRPGAVVQVTTVYGATEETEPGEIRPAPTIAAEGLRMNDVNIIYGNFHIFKVWKMQDAPALILGMDVLGTVPALGIDFEKHDVYLAGSQTVDPNLLRTPGGVLGESAMKK